MFGAMMQKRVVITGLGILSPNGIGKDTFSEAIFNGVSGIKPITLFDVSSFKVKNAGEIANFNPLDFLEAKSLRTLDRATKLVNSAARLALDDSGLKITEDNTNSVGVVLGTTMGSIASISGFDREALKEGVRFVNPALFPNTVINSPASQISIRFKIKGFNATISTGFTSGLDAINYAADFIRLNRAKAALAGGVEELCLETFLGFYKTGFLAGLEEGKVELSCPFDKRRNGIVLAESAVMLVLEDLDSARKRNANIYAEVLGAGNAFEPYRIGKYKVTGSGLKKAMRQALDKSNIQASDIDYISAGANSTIGGDLLEALSIKEVFAPEANGAYVSAIKSIVGESFSASGAVAAISAVLSINKQAVPAMINYQQKDPMCDLNFCAGRTVETKVDNVLVNSFSPSGTNTSMVISKYKE